MNTLDGVSYGPKPHPSRQMTLYLPDRGANGRCILWIHGGGWRGGKRASWSAPAQFFCEQGYACASMDYRLAPEWTFPSQVEDARLAMSFLRAKASEFGFHPDAVATVGSSAGGHLAAMLGVIAPQDSLGAEPGSPPADTRPNAVVCVAAPTTLLDPKDPSGKLAPIFHAFMGCAPQENPSIWRSASPLEMVSGAEPPFLFAHGSADNTVPLHHSEMMRDKLVSSGASARLVVIAGAKHGFAYGIKTPFQQEVMEHIRVFLDQVLPS